MRKVVIITTGGTIAMTETRNDLAKPQLDAEDMILTVPQLETIADLSWINWRNLPSSHLSFADLLELRDLIQAQKKKGVDGVVITHGTDTMEESAYLLDLITDKSGISIVLTGAQRNPSLPSPDGPINLTDAVRVASSEMTKEMGAVIVFNSEIHSARDVEKTHTTKVGAFKSPEFGPLGVINNKQVFWYRRPLIKEEYSVQNLDDRVDIISIALGTDSELIEAAVKMGTKGLIIEALGGGHIPPKALPGVKKAVVRGVPVVMVSKSHGRLLTNTYGYEGSEKSLRQIGVIFGDALSAKKARLKLKVLLGCGYSVDKIRYSFEKHFYQKN